MDSGKSVASPLGDQMEGKSMAKKAVLTVLQAQRYGDDFSGPGDNQRVHRLVG